MRLLVSTLILLSVPSVCSGQWDKVELQIPNLKSLPDRADELQRTLDENNGNLLLSGKVIRITRTLEFDLARHGAIAITADAGVTLVMDGAGPAIRLTGTHAGTASPKSFEPATWNQRMPRVEGIEILGAHPEADGIELQGTVAAVLQQVSVRWCRHGIHLVERNRNVVIADCHLYENSGVGIYLDDVNLHQINVSNSHVSYNRAGGIVVRDGNVRNLQVSGCDIEGNMPDDETETRAANILIDVSGSPEDATRSVAEIAITGCTIQHAANYSGAEERTVAPGGANIRLAGKEVWPIDSVTITGNVLSDTTTNIDIDHAMDVVIGNNTFFAPRPVNLEVSNSQRVVVVGNTFNPRQFVRPGTIRFTNSSDCILSHSTIHQFATPAGAVVLQGCDGFLLSGLVMSDCGSGIVLRDTTDTTISGCRVRGTGEQFPDVDVDDSNSNIRMTGNSFAGKVQLSDAAVVQP
jgi:hypothetical protein